jgi:GDP-4-dehydro-6-deoxy-D-mannose reductase
MLLSITTSQIAVEVDRSRLRPSDIPIFVGKANRARELLGWQPQFSIKQTLHDTLEAARSSVKRNGSLVAND